MVWPRVRFTSCASARSSFQWSDRMSSHSLRLNTLEASVFPSVGICRVRVWCEVSASNSEMTTGDANESRVISPRRHLATNQVKPIQHKRTAAFLNHFITHTASFLNRFSTVCEEVSGNVATCVYVSFAATTPGMTALQQDRTVPFTFFCFFLLFSSMVRMTATGGRCVYLGRRCPLLHPLVAH